MNRGPTVPYTRENRVNLPETPNDLHRLALAFILRRVLKAPGRITKRRAIRVRTLKFDESGRWRDPSALPAPPTGTDRVPPDRVLRVASSCVDQRPGAGEYTESCET